MGCRGIWRFLFGQSTSCRIGRNGLHGEGIAVPSHGRACVGACAFLQRASPPSWTLTDSNLLIAVMYQPCQLCNDVFTNWRQANKITLPAKKTLLTVATKIQMMDFLNEGWSLYTMHICTFCAWLNLAKVYGSVLVWNTCTTCIFLAVSTDPPQMDYWWSLKERAL